MYSDAIVLFVIAYYKVCFVLLDKKYPLNNEYITSGK